MPIIYIHTRDCVKIMCVCIREREKDINFMLIF